MAEEPIPDQKQLQVFAVEAHDWRFGVTQEGRSYAVAADVARTLDYRDARDALRQVEDDEKGTQILRTLGGPQQMWVVYEDGIWELIFRSNKPEAKAIKKRVKAILREIRETGGYAAPVLDELEVARRYVKAIEDKRAAIARAQMAEEQLAIAAPKVDAWEKLASAHGDYSVADAAKMLCRDPRISIGRDRLFATLQSWRWVYRQKSDDRPRAYQEHVDNGRLAELPTWRYDLHTGERIVNAPQVRITVKGLKDIRERLAGGPATLFELVAA